MATLTSAFDTDFTPAVGDFILQVTGGSCQLLRKNTSGAAFALVQTLTNCAVVVSNPIAGAVYRVTAPRPTGMTVQADQ